MWLALRAAPLCESAFCRFVEPRGFSPSLLEIADRFRNLQHQDFKLWRRERDSLATSMWLALRAAPLCESASCRFVEPRGFSPSLLEIADHFRNLQYQDFYLWRRERDSNPRYGLTRTHTFQACSLSHSDTSPKFSHFIINLPWCRAPASASCLGVQLRTRCLGASGKREVSPTRTPLQNTSYLRQPRRKGRALYLLQGSDSRKGQNS